MLEENDRLFEHYNSKYNEANYKKVQKIPIVKKPIDRFQMAAKIVSGHKGKYLEIGAGSGNLALTVVDNFDELVLTELSDKRAMQLKNLFQDNKKVNIIRNNIDYEELPFPIIILM